MARPSRHYTLRSKDVAHILDCSPDDVLAWANSGKLKGRKTGRFWWFTMAGVLKFQRARA